VNEPLGVRKKAREVRSRELLEPFETRAVRQPVEVGPVHRLVDGVGEVEAEFVDEVIETTYFALGVSLTYATDGFIGILSTHHNI